MVYSATTEIYDQVVNQNYNRLVTFAKMNEERVHDSYLKVRDRIQKICFTASSETELWRKLTVYTKTSIYNDFKTEMTTAKPQIDLGSAAESVLQQDLIQDLVDKEYRNQVQFVTQKLFEYLKRNYDESKSYVFRCYYLYNKDGKKITYKELSEITGFSQSKCCGIIQTIKADLKNNLIPYIENGVKG